MKIQRTRRSILFATIGSVVVGLSVSSLREKPIQEKRLRAIYPIGMLRRDERLFDPTNLWSVYHYYLQENLASCLVIDSTKTTSGYEPNLATSWEQMSPTQWRFHIGKELRWSDGSELSGKHLEEYFLALSHRNSRHLVALKSLVTAQWDEDARTLELAFSRPTSQTLLHELSLSDAAILHPTNVDSSWSITSGRYSVSHFDVEKQTLELRVNTYHPKYETNSPNAVELFQPKETNWSLAKENADLWLVPTPSFSEEFRRRVTSAPARIEGPPTVIYYFEFNLNHRLGKSTEARVEFASAIHEFFDKAVPKMPEATPDRQFAAPGYPSRLQNSAVQEIEPKAPISILSGETISISMYYFGEEYTWLSTEFASFLRNRGVNATLSYNRYKKNEPQDWFARASMFSGNQRDSVGSWSFLLSNPDIDVGRKYPDLTADLKKASETSVASERESILQRIHSRFIERALVVPFLLERRYAIHSERISLEHWNEFDLRSRFYDITWK